MIVAAPETVETRCATCRETTDHNVLKGKVVKGGLGVEGTFECTVCQTVHQGIVRFPEPLNVPIMVSVGNKSYPAEVQLFSDDQVAIGDEFEIDDDLVEVTAVEIKDERRRVRRAKSTDIHTLWSKSIREIVIGFSMNVGEVTKAFETTFGPEDEIAVGEEFDLEGHAVIVDRILTTEGKRYRGSYNVREIKRVWLVNRKREARPVADDRPKRGPGSNAPKPKTPPRGRPGGRGPPRTGSKPGAGAPRGRPPAKSGAPRTEGARGSGPRSGPGRTSGPRSSSGPRTGGPRTGGSGGSGRPAGGKRPSGAGRSGGGRPSGGRPPAKRSGAGRGPPRGSSRGPARGPARGAGRGSSKGSTRNGKRGPSRR